jgi:hypothetical protein
LCVYLIEVIASNGSDEKIKIYDLSAIKTFFVVFLFWLLALFFRNWPFMVGLPVSVLASETLISYKTNFIVELEVIKSRVFLDKCHKRNDE